MSWNTNSPDVEYPMEYESIHSLYTKYLIAHEKARLDRDLHGDYTKEGLRYLVEAARIQLRLAKVTTGEYAQEHVDLGGKLIREAHAHMTRLGFIEPIPVDPIDEAPVRKEVPEQAPSDDAQTEDPDTDPFKELENLIGLSAAKKTIASILNALAANEERKEMGLPTKAVPLHMVFMGHAGTGKTTVARIVAKIYKKMGLLSKGHLVEVSKSDLVVGYVGQTAPKTREVIEKAKGGVLFIDEAYAIAEDKFGVSDAIPALLLGMENYRDDLAVIVAGYTDNMREFIRSNEGLKSRFTHFVHFEDYTSDDMLGIFKNMADCMQQKLSEEADACLRDVLMQKEKEIDFGNARGVRNLFDHINLAQADRLAKLRREGTAITKDMLTTFEKEDILVAVENSKHEL